VENELWVALLLTSSVIKPLTAPELAAIFSALALNEQQKKKFVPNKVCVLQENSCLESSPLTS
jgi:hypothetical protein